MKTILWTIGLSSVAWLFVIIGVIVRFVNKNAKLVKLVKHWKFNCEAYQRQFERWNKENEKMDTGDTNRDFLNSLDIVRNNKG